MSHSSQQPPWSYPYPQYHHPECPNGYCQTNNQNLWHPQHHGKKTLIDFNDPALVKGVLVGAAAAWLLGNEDVQRTLMRSTVRVWTMLRGGVEEIKERFQDAEAEIQYERDQQSN